jgi:pimeloyl-ACP methyl ester carboxylesterase
MEVVELPQGTIRYRESGSGEPIVFMHGLLVNGLLWRKVVPLLEADFRCIVPDLPLGSHPEPMNPDADLSPPGLAAIVDRFIGALGLDRVTLVANDTGGAIAQITAANHPERIGRLVLTNCDAFENFLPPAFRPLQWTARVPGLLTLALQGMRFDLLRRRSPMAFGWLIKHDLKGAPLEEWMRPFLSSREIRRDTVKVLRGIHPRYTLEAAERLRSAERPTLIAWAEEDRFFKLSFAERLADAIPGARLERIPDSYTFVSEDQPERLAELISAQHQPATSSPRSASASER